MYGPACNLSRGFSRHPLSGPKNNAGKPLGKNNIAAAKDLAAEILQEASGAPQDLAVADAANFSGLVLGCIGTDFPFK